MDDDLSNFEVEQPMRTKLYVLNLGTAMQHQGQLARQDQNLMKSSAK